jgi:hypothetical protein
MDICRECRVLSGRGLCDEPITLPEESYRLWCVAVCDLETSRIGAPYILRVNRFALCGQASERSCTYHDNDIDTVCVTIIVAS